MMVTIRSMNEEDIEKVYELGLNESRFMVGDHSSGFWTKNQLENWVKSTSDILLIAEDKSKILGYVMSQLHIPTRKATIENLYVREDYRGEGVGTSLIEECLRLLKEKGATYFCAMVEYDNKAMLNLVHSLGFQKGHLFYWVDKHP